MKFKYCGEVIDKECGDYDPFEISVQPLVSRSDPIRIPRMRFQEEPFQMRRIYSDEVELADPDLIRSIKTMKEISS